MAKPTLSIILPVFKEGRIIREALEHLLSLHPDELIVVDGHSEDGTAEIVRREFPHIRCLEAASHNRALQMNQGASSATSEILLFVHADIRLPEDAVSLIRAKMEQGFLGGGFRKRYHPSNFILKLYGFCLNLVCLERMGLLVGTNAIFVKRYVFERWNGFQEAPFLEDVMFSELMRRQARVAIVKKPVTVSSRRYLRNGVLRQIFTNGWILLAHKWFRQSPEKLHRLYRSDSS